MTNVNENWNELPTLEELLIDDEESTISLEEREAYEKEKEDEEKQRKLLEAVKTPHQKAVEKTKAKRFSVAGLLALKANGHAVFLREAEAQNREATVEHHRQAIERILDEAMAIGAELKLNPETGRFKVVRPAPDAVSLPESLKEKILDVFRTKIREKQFQADDLGNSMRQIMMPSPDEEGFAESVGRITELSLKRKDLLHQVTLLQEIETEMEGLIIRF
jgi:hypothetical protein